MKYGVKKAGLVAALVAFGAFGNSSAFAAYYDFDNPGPGIPNDISGTSLVFGNLTVSGFDVAGGNEVAALAYLDVQPTARGGMGVCNVAGIPCQPGEDDNMEGDENLLFELAGGGSFTSMEIWGDHGTYGSNQILIAVGDTTSFSLVDVTFITVGSFQKGVVDLSDITGLSGKFRVKSAAGTETYVANLTSVPIPAAAWLFGSALFGLAGVARRRAASA